MSKQNGSQKFVAHWDKYINGLKTIEENLPSSSYQIELRRSLKRLKRLVRLAALEYYDPKVEDDANAYIEAYQFI